VGITTIIITGGKITIGIICIRKIGISENKNRTHNNNK
jgi:hypothetical protein